MRDIHCHILPGVDDGARDLDESLRMLAAAKAAGVTSMVCTPHCRDPYFDPEAMRDAFDKLVARADGFPLEMAFEVNVTKLLDIGLDWIPRLAFQDGKGFLLELDTFGDAVDFRQYQRVIHAIQSEGLRVIIAHPERYMLVQNDMSAARTLVNMGCELQASADFLSGGLLTRERRTAKRLMDAGLYSHIASDAHKPEHYAWLTKALDKYAGRLR